MTRILPAVLVLLLSAPLFAQVRVDAGIAAGLHKYEQQDLKTKALISPELLVSRGRWAAYAAVDYADLSSAGAMYASHFGIAYRWPLGGNFALRAGAGPSYITVEQLGGEPSWNAQVELGLQSGRLEWFAKVRQYDYSLSEFRIATVSPEGPAFLVGVRVMIIP